MIRTEDFAPFIDKLIEKNCPFALWSVPGSQEIEILITDKKELINSSEYNKLNGQAGFVFAPYRVSDSNPLILLKPGIHVKGVENILQVNIEEIPSAQNEKHKVDSIFSIQHKEYLDEIEHTVNYIKDSKLSKVIISRAIPHQRKSESIGQLYQQVFDQTPNAFVYLVNIPKAGLWMGATPELLVKSEDNNMETVSLAGTQPRHSDNDYGWHTKEIEEQAFVSRYMLDVFYRFGIHPYTTQGPDTMESGKVAHLKTSFYFSAKKIANKLGNFVSELHPTPAVCGLPKSKAEKYISKYEKHDRRYYTGYLGPWRLDDSVRLYVNLRCMEISEDQYILYSGGGITSKSVPEQEWEETKNKAQTLLSAIQAVQNK